MRKDYTGKVRTVPITQIGNHDFSWKPKNAIAQPKEPLIEYKILNGSKKGCSELIPVSREKQKNAHIKSKELNLLNYQYNERNTYQNGFIPLCIFEIDRNRLAKTIIQNRVLANIWRFMFAIPFGVFSTSVAQAPPPPVEGENDVLPF